MSLKKWQLYSLIFIVGIIIIIPLFFLFPPSNKSNDFISIIGTFLGLYGLTITILELLEVKSKQEEINLSVEETKRKFHSILSLTEISRSTKTIEEIQSYLGNNKFEMAYLRLKDLRRVVIDSETHSLFSTISSEEDVILINAQLNSDIMDLHNNIYDNKKIDISLLTNNLERLALLFAHSEQRIKNKSL